MSLSVSQSLCSPCACVFCARCAALCFRSSNATPGGTSFKRPAGHSLGPITRFATGFVSWATWAWFWPKESCPWSSLVPSASVSKSSSAPAPRGPRCSGPWWPSPSTWPPL
eukprot:10780010-Alexandrium_andersonii.AAC.1